MGNQHITYVFQNEQVKGADRLMLLAIADYCDEHGSCYPSYRTLAKKCNVTRRNAIATCQRLETNGHIYISKKDGYVTENGATNRFFMLKWRESVGLNNDEFWGDVNNTSDAHDTSLVMPTTPPTSDAHDTLSQVVSLDEPKDFAPSAEVSPVLYQRGDLVKVISGDKHVGKICIIYGYDEHQVESNEYDTVYIKTNPGTYNINQDCIIHYNAKDNAYELSKVIPDLLKLHNGREWNIAHMLSGTSKKNGYKEYAPYFVDDNMVTPDELAKVVQYYRKQYPDAPMMQSPEIVADWVGKYRAHVAKRNEVPMFTPQEIWDFSDIDEQMGGGE